LEIEETKSKGKKIIYKEQKELGHVYLYLMYNDLREEPFAFVEDLFVDEEVRGKGIGKKLMNELIKIAKEEKCYKIIANSRESRNQVHKFYKKMGFLDYGKEFRMNL
jgi:GNAT superfamily N-acetyltransferase